VFKYEMKFFLSIPLSLLILFSGINIRYAAHFCGGNFVATKISLSGELATCGMETREGNNSSLMTFKSHCCEDITSDYVVSNSYIPSTPVIDTPVQKVVETQFYPAEKLIICQYPFTYLHTDIKPPGNTGSIADSQPVLCIFRI
jgi:hypothetical protein